MGLPSGIDDVVLVEDPRHLDAVCGSRSGGDSLAVVLTPAAEHAASRARIAHVPIDALNSELELLRLSEDQAWRVDALCGYLQEHLAQHQSQASALSGLSAHDLFYWLRILFDSVFSRCVALEAAIDRLQPKRITLVRPAADPVQDDLFFRDGSLTPAVIQVLAPRRGVDVREVESPRVATTIGTEVPRWRVRLSQARNGLSYLAWRTLATRSAPAGATLIPINEGYDVGPLTREWHRRGLPRVPFRVLLWTLEGPMVPALDAGVVGVGQRMLDGMATDARVRDLFTFKDVNVFPVVRSRVDHLLLRVLPRVAALAERARALLRRVPGPLVVGTPAVGLPQLAVLVAARSRGTPIAFYQHGGGYGLLRLPMVERHDLALADYFLSYGHGVKQFYDAAHPAAPSAAPRRRARVLPVGSAALDDLRRRQASRTRRTAGTARTVVYVTTNFARDIRYFDYRTYPDLAYWRLQREVVLRCSRRPTIRLLVKLHPSERLSHPMRDLVRDCGLVNCRVLIETPFAALLDDADLFVIDYPSSTSLLQALTTDRPIVALADAEFTRPDPRALELLRRRARVATSRDEFLRHLDVALDDRDWSVQEPRNDDFLEAYGTGVDGDAADRAVSALLDLHARRGSPLADLKAREVTTV